MSRRTGWPLRRRRALAVSDGSAETGLPAPETAAMILPGSARVGSLDALLREVDSLRLSLETDLTFAASAVEAGAPAFAMDIIDSDRSRLAEFEARSLEHLTVLAEAPDELETARRRRLRVSATPFVAAAAMVGFLVGVAPSMLPSQEDVTPTAASATSSLEELKDLVETGSTSEVREASATLHEQLLEVVAQAGNDPAAVRQALLLLSYEREAIVRSGDSAALHDVWLQSAVLANRIRNVLPVTVRRTVPRVLVVPTPTASASPKPKPTASPTPSPTPSPSASPKPKPSPSPSTSPSSHGVLPSGNPAVAP